MCLFDDLDRIGLFPIVSAAHVAAGFSAKEWCDACITAVGAGKGGGRPELANATVPGGSDVLDRVLEIATSFAQSKVGGC